MADTLASAPDIAALGNAPVAPTVPEAPTLPVSAPEDDPFLLSVRAATQNLPSPDEVVQAGVQEGKSPEQQAAALERLRADVNTGFQTVEVNEKGSELHITLLMPDRSMCQQPIV